MPQLRSDVARNRRSLVEAAIQSFRELGWDVPLDTVARRAGVGNATLYRHFPSRNDLYEAAFVEVRERLVAVLDRYRDVGDGWQALHALIVEILATIPIGPAMGSVTQERLACSEALRSAVDEVRDALDRVLRVAQRQGAARADVDVEDVGLLLDAMRPVVVVSDKVAPEFWRRHLVLLLDALRAPGASPLPPPVSDVEQRLRLADAVKQV